MNITLLLYLKKFLRRKVHSFEIGQSQLFLKASTQHNVSIMDLRYFFGTVFLIQIFAIFRIETTTAASVPCVGQIVTASGPGGYPTYYYYCPQYQYPQTAVVYQATPTVGQYPYYIWTNTPVTGVTVPQTPNSLATPKPPSSDHFGDPYNPKSDVENIY